MAKFLDSSGVSYLWKKIKENFAPISHTTQVANWETLAHIKPSKSYTTAATLTTPAASATTAPTIEGITTTAGRYYAVEVDASGVPFVNVPWSAEEATDATNAKYLVDDSKNPINAGSANQPVYFTAGRPVAVSSKNVWGKALYGTGDVGGNISLGVGTDGSTDATHPLFGIFKIDDTTTTDNAFIGFSKHFATDGAFGAEGANTKVVLNWDANVTSTDTMESSSLVVGQGQFTYAQHPVLVSAGSTGTGAGKLYLLGISDYNNFAGPTGNGIGSGLISTKTRESATAPYIADNGEMWAYNATSAKVERLVTTSDIPDISDTVTTDGQAKGMEVAIFKSGKELQSASAAYPGGVGNDTTPMYLGVDGTLSACAATVGSANKPMYLNGGVMTECDSTLNINANGYSTGLGTLSGSAWTPIATTAGKPVQFTDGKPVAFDTFADGVGAVTQANADSSTKLATTAFVHSAVNAALTQALVYKGTKTAAEITALTADGVKVGDVYIVKGTGTVSGQTVENGDMVICKSATAPITWDVVQANIDGAVTSNGTALAGRIAVFKSGNEIEGKGLSGVIEAEYLDGVGSETNPIYIDVDGSFSACAITVGSSTKPMYLNAGEMTECGDTLDVGISGNAATATKLTGSIDSNVTAVTQAVTDNSTKVATTAFVASCVLSNSDIDSAIAAAATL